MRALVGLGNPGEKYDHTRHNAGFDCVDAVARVLGAGAWKRHSGCLVAEVRVGGEKHYLVKPQQFMNLSGRPLRTFAEYYDIPQSDLCIVADDVYVAPGSARIRHTGADGGHNGWKSVLSVFPEGAFLRVRVGVGLFPSDLSERQHHPSLEDYVLQRQSAHDAKQTALLIDKIVPNLIEWLGTGRISEETVHL
jgi:peptidyl-tRNA hydrolase, PTH1 family